MRLLTWCHIAIIFAVVSRWILTHLSLAYRDILTCRIWRAPQPSLVLYTRQLNRECSLLVTSIALNAGYPSGVVTRTRKMGEEVSVSSVWSKLRWRGVSFYIIQFAEQSEMGSIDVIKNFIDGGRKEETIVSFYEITRYDGHIEKSMA